MQGREKMRAAPGRNTAPNSDRLTDYRAEGCWSITCLQERLGEILLHLQQPMPKVQKCMAWALFEAVLVEYANARFLASPGEGGLP